MSLRGIISKMRVKFPAWVMALVAFVSVGLTLGADRLALASQLSKEDARISVLEVQHAAMAEHMRTFSGDVLQSLKEINAQSLQSALLLQRLSDRQAEIMRRLKISAQGGQP